MTGFMRCRFFFSSRRRHTRFKCDWSSDVCSSDLSGEKMQAKGIEDFGAGIVELAPFLRDRVTELRDWSDVKLLTVKVDRLRRWYRPGLVCIGDAAHAMSPVGGVGINLAIQDAVAAANILARHLREGSGSAEVVVKLQRRRAFPTRFKQRMQDLLRNQDGHGLLTPKPQRLPWRRRTLSPS